MKKKYTLVIRDDDYMHLIKSERLSDLIVLIESKGVDNMHKIESKDVILAGTKGESTFILFVENEYSENDSSLKTIEIHDRLNFEKRQSDSMYYKFKTKDDIYGFANIEDMTLIRVSSIHGVYVVTDHTIKSIDKSKAYSYSTAKKEYSKLINQIKKGM